MSRSSSLRRRRVWGLDHYKICPSALRGDTQSRFVNVQYIRNASNCPLGPPCRSQRAWASAFLARRFVPSWHACRLRHALLCSALRRSRRGSLSSPCTPGTTAGTPSSSPPSPCADRPHAATAPEWVETGCPWGARPTGASVDSAALPQAPTGGSSTCSRRGDSKKLTAHLAWLGLASAVIISPRQDGARGSK